MPVVKLQLSDVKRLVLEIYMPFAEIKRAIPWPNEIGRNENDAEHSFSLALVGLAIGAKLGLNPQKIAYYATIHDLVELKAGDTSVWDEDGVKTKVEREEKALHWIEKEFSTTPELASAIKSYESLRDEESRFVYALDKILPPILIIADNGQFFKVNNITRERFAKKSQEMSKKIAKHLLVLQWHDEIVAEILARYTELLAPDDTKV